MRIDAYFQQGQQCIAQSSFIQLSTMNYEKWGTYEGFIRGELSCIDGSVLHLREFLDVETTVERLMYAYQYMAPDGNLLFRYDNTEHHKKLELSTYPHHKHDGSETCVIASDGPELTDILEEIELLIMLP